eukprot:gnl/MRDRNA2_/MRDRNA2_101625_c0_seq1.p1 gnl/MRDRNA2_/MRDRNA2_101625_c0~~gnl/MRDRNA2_/MRDRNA2_101625_c0_seq1.p1  ORF type:complete len:106 (+),score=29.58 gnl/MRDRNA2_/MRDRNA2_101625_c0_seq1:89-406(+)
MDTLRYINVQVEAMDMNSDIMDKRQVEDKCAEGEGDSTCDSDNGDFSESSSKPLDLGDWMWESSDDDDEEGFEGWPVWSPASYKSNQVKQSLEGFKGLLQRAELP